MNAFCWIGVWLGGKGFSGKLLGGSILKYVCGGVVSLYISGHWFLSYSQSVLVSLFCIFLLVCLPPSLFLYSLLPPLCILSFLMLILISPSSLLLILLSLFLSSSSSPPTYPSSPFLIFLLPMLLPLPAIFLSFPSFSELASGIERSRLCRAYLCEISCRRLEGDKAKVTVPGDDEILFCLQDAKDTV